MASQPRKQPSSLMTDNQIETIAGAIRSIAHGSMHGPGGLEGLAMSLAGQGLRSPVGDNLSRIADALERIATCMEPSEDE